MNNKINNDKIMTYKSMNQKALMGSEAETQLGFRPVSLARVCVCVCVSVTLCWYTYGGLTQGHELRPYLVLFKGEQTLLSAQ